MTVTTSTGPGNAGSGKQAATSGATSGAEVQQHEDRVTLTIDGYQISVPKGTLIIRAAEMLGIQIPRFCDHPLLDPVGACRQCLVEIPDAGNGRGMPKPAASCTTTVAEGMVVKTQLTSAVADKAQHGIMEFLLINHPLDCPICDKGGECPLQNQAMSNGRSTSRFVDVKRTYPKPIHISPQVLLDRERCILCARCTRFSVQIAGDPFITMLERGALQQVGIYEKEPFESYFSGNTVQICPVGALTGASYRFRARPFDLVSTPTICEHCASGCALRTDHRRGKVLRRWAGDDPAVNEEWNCDKGRWAFQYATARDRISSPMVREDDGTLVATSWPDALDVAARGLAAARDNGGVGVLVGGRVTLEDAYAYAKFARLALGTNDIDFRARPHSAEETRFLTEHVAGRALEVTYADLETAPAVLLAGFEPEDESPIVYLRLRKGARKNGVRVFSVAPFASRGLKRMFGQLVPAAPGTETEVLDALVEGKADSGLDEVGQGAAALMREPGAVIVVGERLAEVPGALTAAARLAAATGARLAWIPRRAGERGAIEAGALPTLLPGGRPVADAAARVDLAAAWGVPELPSTPGRDTAAILAAAASGQLAGLVVAGVDPLDLPDPAGALAALDSVPFLVSVELRESVVTERADVVLPIAPAAEKSGTFLDWEGRLRPFDKALTSSNADSDCEVLDALAAGMGVPMRTGTPGAAKAELDEIGTWSRQPARPAAEAPAVPALPQPDPGEAVLVTWHLLLDKGRLQDSEPFLAGTARPAVARLSAATAAEIGVADGQSVTVSGDGGSVTLPLVITDLPDRVVWLPANSEGCAVRRDLGVGSGAVVRITPGSLA